MTPVHSCLCYNVSMVKNMLRKKDFLTIIIITVLILLPLETEASERTELFYLAAGDSIANGYSCDDTEITPYPALVQAELENREGYKVRLNNIAKNGISTERFSHTKLQDEEVLEQIGEADVITVTLGANDLMNEFKAACQNVLGRTEKFSNIQDAMEMLHTEMRAHPALVLKAIGAIASWDYDAFEENYSAMMGEITANTKESVQIIATDIYNPTIGLGMPGTLNKVVYSIIGKMNDIIKEHADEYGYEVISLEELGIYDYVQSDGLHPTQEGQQLIADALIGKITAGEAGTDSGEGAAAREDTQREAEASPDSGNRMTGAAAVVSMALTGVLLLVSGIRKKKK